MNIKYRISDSSQEKELIHYLKRRESEQKFIYLWEGAEIYYETFSNTDNVNRSDSRRLNYKSFYLKHIKDETKNHFFSLISLGCGNACQEKPLLSSLADSGIKFKYIGVDSSKHMLELARENLQSIANLDSEFICADFNSTHFKSEIHNLIGESDVAIYAFLGWTFGNPNQTSITDTLYNVLRPNDLLWFDVLSRDDGSKGIKLKLFERYTSYLYKDDVVYLRFVPLRKIGIPFQNGKMILETSNENSLGSIVFTFSFLFEKKTVINYKGEILHFLPREKINLMQIRNYNEKKLVYFFKEHNFHLVNSEQGNVNEWLNESQFLFKLSVTD